MNGVEKYTLGIVDDHPMLLDGLQQIFEAHPHFDLLWTAPDAATSRQKLSQLPPKLLMLDIRLPDGDGQELLLEITEKWPDIKILGFTSFESPFAVQQFMKNGAMGFLRKDAGKDIIIEALYCIAEGKKYLQAELKEMMLEWQIGATHTTQPEIKLTRREKEILRLIIDEFTTHEMAGHLNISPHTIETHRQNLLLKTGMRNTAGLVKAALKLNLV